MTRSDIENRVDNDLSDTTDDFCAELNSTCKKSVDRSLCVDIWRVIGPPIIANLYNPVINELDAERRSNWT